MIIRRSRILIACLLASVFFVVPGTAAVSSASDLDISIVSTPGCPGIFLRPGDDLQAALDSHPAGTTFCLAPGTYRIRKALIPKTAQRLIGVIPGTAHITGAEKVGATRTGEHWVITDQKTLGTAPSSISPACMPIGDLDPKGMCIYRDQVFLNDVSLWQVGSLNQLSPGEFYWDYDTNKIYLKDDPTAKDLEVGVSSSAAFRDINDGVTVKGLVVEKFGVAARDAALWGGTNWVVVDNEVRLNHGGGARVGPGGLLQNNYIHHNGQLGIHGGQSPDARGIVIADNELAFNNSAGHNWSWEAGATKFTNSTGLVVRNNYVHDNFGTGLWFDVDNLRVICEGNRVENNLGQGIVFEISFDSVARNNIVRNNATGLGGWAAGILVAESPNIEIVSNLVEGNGNGIIAVQEPRGSSHHGERHMIDLFVHGNTIVQHRGWAAGFFVYHNDNDASYFTSKNNRFRNNTYRLGDRADGFHFSWKDGGLTAHGWKDAGQDVTGVFNQL
jgi:hypothetical protein